MAVFEQLENILAELHTKICQNLTISPKEQHPFATFKSPDGSIEGSLLTYSGKVVDKLIYAKINAKPMSFGTMRLTTWLNSTIAVPHLAFEFGTMPNLFFYMDYIPRIDLWTNLDYFENYYGAVNETYLDLRENPDLSLFVSKSLYVRQLQSPAHICFTSTHGEDALELVRTLAHEMCDRWLVWVDQADPVAEANRNTLAERDRHMRRLSAERDPGNAAIAKILGEDFTHQLVRALWEAES